MNLSRRAARRQRGRLRKVLAARRPLPSGALRRVMERAIAISGTTIEEFTDGLGFDQVDWSVVRLFERPPNYRNAWEMKS